MREYFNLWLFQEAKKTRRDLKPHNFETSCSNFIKPSTIHLWNLLLCYFVIALRSRQSGQVHSCSHLVARSHLRVWILIVSTCSWLCRRRVAPRRVLRNPSPACIPLSLRIDRVCEELWGLVFSRWSETAWRTVGGSRVRLLSMMADPARVSALSLPTTPAWPGLKIQVIFSRALLRSVASQSE